MIIVSPWRLSTYTCCYLSPDLSLDSLLATVIGLKMRNHHAVFGIIAEMVGRQNDAA
jgi:hypothetical protein